MINFIGGVLFTSVLFATISIFLSTKKFNKIVKNFKEELK